MIWWISQRRYGGSLREWTVVCSDGLPYNLMLRLLAEQRCCGICNKSFFGEEIRKHFKDCHPNEKEEFYLEFDWVVLKIGDGHFEMNMSKTFFELNWVPFMSDLCYIMGFKSEAAQLSAKKCSDNHKAWRLLLMFYIGSVAELVLPYVRECLNTDKQPTGE